MEIKKKSGVASVGVLGTVNCVFENNNYLYSISVEKKYLKMHSSKIIKEGSVVHIVPSWNEKIRYKKIEQLFSLINSYFMYLEDEDGELENARYIDVKVKFYSYARKTFPNLNDKYRPHIIIDNNGKYIGIEFTKSNLKEFDVYDNATIKFLYPGIDYSILKNGVTFKIREGAKDVGEGIIIA